jgi:hypothetical protein
MTIPTSADSELVAVRAFEQIAEGSFTEGQRPVRMALMEAINNQGSLGDRKIHLGFSWRTTV